MSANEFLMMLAATVAAVTVVGVGVHKATVLTKRFIHFLDDYFGEEERPGFQGRPGMQERMRIIEQELRHISYEMKPNSGTSIKDAINRIEKRLEALEQRKD